MNSPIELESKVRSLRNASQALGTFSDRAIFDGIDAALALWSSGPLARDARELSALSGASEAMLSFGLSRTAAAHRKPALERWLQEARNEAGKKPARPRVVAQVLAGNVAGPAIPASIEALLARCAVIQKPAEGDPVTPLSWKQCLDRAAPELGNAVEIASWRGGDRSVEDPLFRDVDHVVATGGAAMATSIGKRVPQARIHGPRFSIGIHDASSDATTEEIAREIAIWDQEGCLSPRILFVENAPENFARPLADAMRGWEERWPARPRDPGIASQVHALRARTALGAGGAFAPENTAWTVVWDNTPSLDWSPLPRTIRVTQQPADPETLLMPARGSLQAIGASSRWQPLADRLGIARFPLESIQDPPAGWRADGRSGLAELIALKAGPHP